MSDTVLVCDDGVSQSSTSSESFDTTTQERITTSLTFENETAGSSFMEKVFRHTELYQKIIKLSWNRGDRQQGPDISQCLKDGTPMQYQRMKIPIFQM